MRALQVLGPSTGGIRVHVATLAHHLGSIGVEAPVVGPAGVMTGLGAQAGVVEVPAGMSPLALLRARRQLQPWRGAADVVHAHGLKAAWTCVRGRPERPVVVTVHNVVLDESAGAGASIRRRLEREVLRRADRVIAPTAAIASGLDGVVAADRVSVVVPASPIPVIRRQGAELRARLGIDDGSPLVVCVARLHPQKDLTMLLRAWSEVARHLPDARLVVVGEGPDRAALETSAADLGISTSLDMVGFDDHAVDWIAAADVVAISSVWEAIPLVLAEAMHLGVPVVSTDVGLATELLGDGAAGAVVPVGDAAGFARALADLLGDAAARRNAAHSASERSTSRFDPVVLTEAVSQIYQELVTTHGDRQ